MKIVLDESLGLQSLQSDTICIKPIKLKGADDLGDYLNKYDSRFRLSKKVPFANWKLEDEIAYFIDRFPSGSRIIYFYDPQVQPADELRKLSNWLMNERYVIAIPAPSNRALLYMLVEKVQSLSKPTKQEVNRLVERLTRTVSGTVISQKPAVFSNGRMLRAYREPKSEIYKRANWKNEKITVEGSGKLSEVLKAVIVPKDDSEYWVVKKGVSIDFQGDRDITIAKPHLPVNVPFIHIARIPINKRWGESDD
ncbi:hypothetical protein [Guptibacillus algicola]|uniref:hypothetical protein n=1 Tax=Guptibacillus algicola TaxID=225844 RepID=UPI001CD3CC03|nr:hypothetical protein [Alkalihalobacillus algicola]MCA0989603.1 hypothetical protein [Alkalihalobacillus algicola]